MPQLVRILHLQAEETGMKMAFVAALAASLAAPAVAWAQRPDRAVEQPIVRSFNWFSYVGGDDIRAACQPGGRNHLRLVYNGLWNEQVRTYEIFLQPDGTAGLTVGVLNGQGSGGDLSNLFVSKGTDVTSPWQMKKGQRVLDPSETRELVGLLEASAAFGPPRDGMRLPDNDFWWTIASCRDGKWGFQAYHYPTDGFTNAKFMERLFAFDNVAIAVNRPRKLEPAEMRRDMNAPGIRSQQTIAWMLVVGKDGLRPR
jgi:hypothetical protein